MRRPVIQLNGESRLTAEAQTLLLQILRETFGRKVVLLDYHVTNSHPDYIVLSARLAHPTVEVMVKLAGPDAPIPCPFDRTVALHRLVRAQTGVPLPEVLAADISYRTWPVRYMIKRYVPGVEWVNARPQMNEQELTDAYYQIGRAVAELHNVRFPAFGELQADGTINQGEFFIVELAKRAKRRIPNANHAELFTALLKDRSNLFIDVTQASLCHEDLHGHNILFHEEQGRWRLSAILDFDSAWAGHHESDLARLELWRGMVGQGFWEAYRVMHPLAELYSQRRPIYQLLWCLEYASNTPEHLADTQRVCGELGLEPIKHFG